MGYGVAQPVSVHAFPFRIQGGLSLSSAPPCTWRSCVKPLASHFYKEGVPAGQTSCSLVTDCSPATFMHAGPPSVETPLTLGVPSSVIACIGTSIREGPRVTGTGFLHPSLWVFGSSRRFVYVQKKNANHRQLCCRHTVTFRVTFSFVGGASHEAVNRPMSTFHLLRWRGASLIPPQGGTILCSGRPVSRVPLSHGAPHTSARVVVGCLVHLYTRQV